MLREAGFEFANVKEDGKQVVIKELEVHVMSWDDAPEPVAAVETEEEEVAVAD